MHFQLMGRDFFRHLSVASFDGIISLKSLNKTVAFRDDHKAPQVELRVPLDCDWIPSQVADSLRARYSHRIDRNGQLVIESCRTYSEQLNMADCVDKLRSTLFESQSIVNGLAQCETKVSRRAEIKNDIKRRLITFENDL
ncbi:unnamed protein product [Thelazia callipaeda]|uniref:DUF3509 domain-containing protein n=1 Tax=Thelazia callipaeda TaxID=103827 RepID=A0A0N5CUX7_THECL|nr:unnamed protein product [Thelazia callipaeda]